MFPTSHNKERGQETFLLHSHEHYQKLHPCYVLLNLVNYVKSLFKDAFTRLGLFKQPPPEEDDHTGDGYVLSTDSRTGSIVLVPVQVVTAMIMTNLRVIEYGDFVKRFGDEVMKKDRVCSVCLEAMEKRDEMRELCKCSHVFHRECIDGWVKEGGLTYPLCRSALYPDPMDFGRPDPRNSFLDCDVIY
ncbi:hypothetical protein ES288_A09G220400v1 [Gossypium darwinii]|uniref:RING-type domain-containing protein n=1 Tax=Gossypium darwinii TaxID=34276 RepID=A0A5D2FDY8_GOSDA|nr:hypothetical protein ES288_A09G220400v1 [Gossypium darwinii]